MKERPKLLMLASNVLSAAETKNECRSTPVFRGKESNPFQNFLALCHAAPRVERVVARVLVPLHHRR